MKLEFELVPDGCWYSNLRSLLSQRQWDAVRKDAYARSGGACTVCGVKTRYLDAHERWGYDEEKGIQKLLDVVALCKDCHAVVHIGRTQLLGDEKRACEHFMKVNGVSYAEYRAALGRANEVHRRRNRVSEWALDLTWLNRFCEKNFLDGKGR